MYSCSEGILSTPNPPPPACTWQGAASVIQTDALGESQEIAHLDAGNYFGEVRRSRTL